VQATALITVITAYGGRRSTRRADRLLFSVTTFCAALVSSALSASLCAWASSATSSSESGSRQPRKPTMKPLVPLGLYTSSSMARPGPCSHSSTDDVSPAIVVIDSTDTSMDDCGVPTPDSEKRSVLAASPSSPSVEGTAATTTMYEPDASKASSTSTVKSPTSLGRNVSPGSDCA